jgi:fumarate reductase subunit D
VVCAGVLEFCDRPERAVRLLAEHVAPRGRLLLLFPVQGLWAGAYRIYHRLHGVHARAFSVDRVQAWVERSGLRVSATSHPLPLSAVLRAEKVSP